MDLVRVRGRERQRERGVDAEREAATSDQSDVARAIREAIGATDDEPVQVTTPQFDRPPSMPPVRTPPVDWEKLRTMTKDELKTLGCGNWDSRLMLFPKEWYLEIPDGFVVTGISGRAYNFHRADGMDDTRFGCLAYGVVAVDAAPEEEEGKDL